jgi:PAS domain S-box-containing protein
MYLGEGTSLPEELSALFEGISHAYDSAEDALRRAYESPGGAGEGAAELVHANVQLQHEIALCKEREKILEASSRYFQALIERSSDGILVVDAEGCPCYSYFHVFFEDIHPEDVRKAVETLGHVAESPGARAQAEVRVQQDDGSWHHAEVTGTNYLDDPDVGGVVLAFRDITDRKRAEETLQESEEKLRTIFHAANDAIIYVDTEGRVVDVNSRCETLTGYEREDFLGANVFGLGVFDPEELSRVLAMFAESVAERSHRDFVEVSLRHRDGHTIPTEVSSNSVLRPDGTMLGFLTVARDITERKQTEQALKIYAEDLADRNTELKLAREELALLNEGLEQKVAERTGDVEKLLEQKNGFIHQLSHDLKTPLTPLVALLPMLREDGVNAEQAEILDVAMESVDSMRELVSKTLKLAELNSEASWSLTDVEMSHQVRGILSKKEPLAAERGIGLQNLVQQEVMVKADATALRELLDNLITNAIKYTPQGGEVTLQAQRKKGLLEVSVADTGIGMTEEQQARVFDEFYKVDPSRHDLESSGLGLAICQRIVERLGGRIWVESEGLGKGSTFYFTLPTSKEPAGGGRAESPKLQGKRGRGE